LSSVSDVIAVFTGRLKEGSEKLGGRCIGFSVLPCILTDFPPLSDRFELNLFWKKALKIQYFRFHHYTMDLQWITWLSCVTLGCRPKKPISASEQKPYINCNALNKNV